LRFLASRYPIFPPAPNSAILVVMEKRSRWVAWGGQMGFAIRPEKFINMLSGPRGAPAHSNGCRIPVTVENAIIHVTDRSKGQAAGFPALA